MALIAGGAEPADRRADRQRWHARALLRAVVERSSRRRFWILVALAVVQVAFTLFVNPAGYLTWDSGTYHFAVETLASGRSLTVRNGYEQHPSPELVVGQLRLHGGHLHSQYPDGYTLLSLPFYLLLGFRGLFLLSSVAFLGTLLLAFRLARELFDRDTAILATILYGGATYSWEWSQSDYPHLACTFFVVLATYCALRAWQGRGAVWALGSGLAVGFAITLHLDSLFAVPAMYLPFIFSRPIRWRAAALVTLGILPALVALSLANHTKFETWSPFSYGSSVGNLRIAAYVPMACAGLATIAAFRWSLSLRRRRQILLLLFGAAIVVVGLVRLRTLHAFAEHLVTGTYQILVDLRIRDPALPEPALTRTVDGAMVYMGGVKKSLLESCPYLVLIVFVLRDAVVRRDEWAHRVAFIAAGPATYVAFFGYLAWHGSVALNMRYLNPVLPALAVLAAIAWRQAWPSLPRYQILVRAAATALLLAAAMARPLALRLQETLFLDLPLLLAGLIAALEIARRAGSVAVTRPLRVLLLAAAVWAGAMAVGRDWWSSAQRRATLVAVGRAAAPLLPPRALVLANRPDQVWYLIDRVPEVEIAQPARDGFDSLQRLVDDHLRHGPAYMIAPLAELQQDVQSGILAGYDVRPVAGWSEPDVILARVAPRSAMLDQVIPLQGSIGVASVLTPHRGPSEPPP